MRRSARSTRPRPPAAMTSPATAGPRTRAALTITEFRLTALRTDSGPTISTRKACRVGFSKASARPSSAARPSTCQSWTVSVRVRTASTRARAPITACSATRRRRLSVRSATSPPYGPTSRIGRVCAAKVRPTHVADPVISRTSQAWATICIQVPTSEIDCPAKYSRKLGIDSAEKVSRRSAASRPAPRASSIAVMPPSSPTPRSPRHTQQQRHGQSLHVRLEDRHPDGGSAEGRGPDGGLRRGPRARDVSRRSGCSVRSGWSSAPGGGTRSCSSCRAACSAAARWPAWPPAHAAPGAASTRS